MGGSIKRVMLLFVAGFFLMEAQQDGSAGKSAVSVAVAIAPSSSLPKPGARLRDRLVEEFQRSYATSAIAADDLTVARRLGKEQKASYLVFAEVPESAGHGVGGMTKKLKVPLRGKGDESKNVERVTFTIERSSDGKAVSALDLEWTGSAKDDELTNLAKTVTTDFLAKIGEDLRPTTAVTVQRQGRPRLVVQTAHSTQVVDFAFSRDGEIAATLGSDGVLKIWAAKDRTEIRTFAGYRLKGVAMSADGAMLATVDQKGTVRIIDTHEGLIVKTIINPRPPDSNEPQTFLTLSPNPTPIAYSADGRIVVYGGTSGVSVVDAGTGRWVRSIASGDQVEALALDPSGRLIAVSVGEASGKAAMGALVHGSGVNHFQIYRTDSGVAVKDGPFAAYVGTISALAFDKDGRRLFVGSRNGSIRVFDSGNGEQIGKDALLLNQCDRPYETNRTIDKGRKILKKVPGLDKLPVARTVESVDVATPVGSVCEAIDTVNKFRTQGFADAIMQVTPAAAIRSLDVSADGRWLAYGLADNSIKVRSLVDGASAVTTIAKSEASGKAEEGKALPPVLFAQMRSPVKLSYEGGQLFVNAIRDFKTVNRWNASTGDAVSSLAVAKRDLSPFPIPLPMGAVPQFSRDGAHLTTASLTNGVKLWDLRTGRAEQVSDTPLISMHLPVSADGKYVVGLEPKLPVKSGAMPEFGVTVKEVGSGSDVLRIADLFSLIAIPSFSPDSRFLAVYGLDLKIYRISDSKVVYKGQAVQGVEFSPNGEFLAYTKENELDIVRTSDWKTVTTAKLKGSDSDFFQMSRLNFDADSTSLAVLDEGKIKLWDLASGAMVSHTFSAPSGGNGRGDAISIVFAPGKKRISYTTDRSLFHWDYAVDKVTPSSLSTDFWGNLAYSNDGTVLALGGAENRVRLFDVDRDVEIGSLISPSQKDWIMVTPDGRLDASRIEDIDEVHWIVRDEPTKAQPLELFTRDFYEPRLLPRVLKHEAFAEIPDLSGRNRALPKVTISEVTPNGDSRVKVTVTVENAQSEMQRDEAGKAMSSGAQRLRLFRDGRLVGSAPNGEGAVKLDGSGRASFEFSVAIPHAAEASKVDFSAYAFNREMAKSLTAHKTYEVAAAGSQDAKRGRAYIVAIGVNSNQVKGFNLKYAANDAKAIAAQVAERLAAGNQYSSVVQIPLISDAVGGDPSKAAGLAKKENVKAVLDVLAGRATSAGAALTAAIPATKELKKATPDDLVLFFFAGHGFADTSGTFYLLPSDLGKDLGPEIAAYTPKAISSDELSTWFQAVDSRDLLMIIDACQSAAAVEKDGFKPGPMGSRGLGQMAYDKGMQILAATQRADAALEIDKLDHGLLTFALVDEGLVNKQADFRPIDKKITLGEWLRYGVKRVPEIDEALQKGQFTERGNTRPKRPHASTQSPALFDFEWNREDTLLTSLP